MCETPVDANSHLCRFSNERFRHELVDAEADRKFDRGFDR